MSKNGISRLLARPCIVYISYKWVPEGGKDRICFEGFERMKGFSICEPDIYAYNTMVHGFLKIGYVDSAKKLLKQMADRGLEWNVVTYGMMINWYCKNRRVDRAMELVNEMSKLGLAPNLQCYTAILTALCMEGRLVQVEQLFDEMLGIGIVPDHVMFVLLIKNLKGGYRSLMVQKLLQAIALKCKVDMSGFHALSACCHEVLPRETEDLLDEILRSDVLPLHEISNVLIGALCAEGKFDAACRLIQKIAGSGYQPSVPTYNLLVSCVCNEGQLNDARSLVSFFMQLSSAYSSLVTYSIKINALCKIGNVDLALQQLDEMIHKGINPTAPIYDSVIGSLSRAGRLNEADLVFNNMLKAGVLPDEVVYTTLIKSYCESRKAVQACRLFDQMIRRGLLPSSRTYGALINGFIKKNMFRNACHFLDMMLKDGFVPNIFLYTKLVNQFSKKGEIRLALDSFNLMLRNQIEPDLIAYGSLICALCRKKRSSKTHSLSRKLKNPRSMLFRLEFKGQSTSGMLQTKKLSCMSISEKVGFALEKMQDMVNIGLMPDLHIYNGIINGLCQAKRMEDAYKYISQMQGNGLVPNQVTYTILMKSYIRSGEIDNAVSLFNQMSINGCMPDNISYNTLIFGLCVAGRAIEGLSLVHGMAKRGLFPNKFIYATLFECFIRCHPRDITIKLLEEMMLCNYIPRLRSYKNLFWVLCSMKNLFGVRRAYNLLLKAGRKPDRITKRHLLKTCCRRGEFEMALAIMENKLIDDD
ncbi:hypothetical protein HPP92_002890 [Vanilla planifolia]|uniref:Pentatricopeptide repeat-containing protein n=1 Tax=Vanilla planifolia TaxID=51239 RepID=A0A835SFK2_VANPL|nr:hypothetical protein HPP92_002890 [Vanilla planifolia]